MMYYKSLHFAAYDNLKKKALESLWNSSDLNDSFIETEFVTTRQMRFLGEASLRLLDAYINKKFANKDRISHFEELQVFNHHQYLRVMAAAAVAITVKWHSDRSDYWNSDMSVWFWVDQKSLTTLERDILKTIDYKVFQYMPENQHIGW